MLNSAPSETEKSETEGSETKESNLVIEDEEERKECTSVKRLRVTLPVKLIRSPNMTKIIFGVWFIPNYVKVVYHKLLVT